MKFNSILNLTFWLLILFNYCSFAQNTSIAPVEEDEKEEHEHLQERIDFFHTQRATKYGGMPFGAMNKAKAQFDALRSLKNQPVPMDAGIWNWENLGPGNIGGRIRAILIHPTSPSIMWIGAASGGIWKTESGGASWYPVDDFMANLAVTSIVYDPTNLNIMYASTGEGFTTNMNPRPPDQREPPGNGIFKSTDAGISWFQLPATNDTNFTYVSRLIHHPSQTNILYAATQRFNDQTGAVYKTTDGGLNWQRLLRTPSGGRDVKMHQQKPNRVFLGTASGAYMSFNEGLTWDTLQTGLTGDLPSFTGRCESTFGNGDTVYASLQRFSGEIWRSVDSGKTWSQQCTGYNYLGSQGWYDNVIWTDPTNSNFVVVGGIDIWRSTDGGTTLTKISNWTQYRPPTVVTSAHADQHVIIHHPNFDGTTNLKIYVANDGGIQTTDNIQTVTQTGWTSLSYNLSINQFYGGSAAPNGSVIIGGTQDNDNIRYTPVGGYNGWFQAKTGDGGCTAVDPSNNNILYTEYVNLRIDRSTDGGNTYFTKVNGLGDANSGRALFIAPFIMDPNNSNTLIAGGTTIWKTTNQGDNWSAISPVFGNSCSALDVAFGNPSMIWAGFADGTVALTTNGGTNWNTVDTASPGLPNRYITDIAVNPNDPYEVFVTIGGYNDSSVWRTTNLGVSWELRSGSGIYKIPAVQVNTIRFHPLQPQWVYIGTDLGILASEDKGETWSTSPLYSRNEVPSNVVVSELFWQGTDKLIAATFGRGMYRCRPIPVVYVDGSYSGVEDGTEFQPYNTVNEGFDAAGNGTVISIKNGDYLNAPLSSLKKGVIRATGGNPVVIH